MAELFLPVTWADNGVSNSMYVRDIKIKKREDLSKAELCDFKGLNIL